MTVVSGAFARRIVSVARGPESPETLLAGVGLAPGAPGLDAAREVVDAEAFYELIERATGESDGDLPFRYAAALHPDDLGALGLAIKTANTVRDALQRLVRYILVLTDSLEYELRDDGDGAVLVLSRPDHRRGAQIANVCALAAVISVLREIAISSVAPVEVAFRHPRPRSADGYEAFFGCPVRFGVDINGLHLDAQSLGIRTRLADEGLSAFLLAQLEDLRREQPDRSLVTQVRSAVADSLPDGLPRRGLIARRLGMSERTLHRRLAEHGQTYQSIANRARQEAAESLLVNGNHALAEVAFLTGFADQSAFQRAFKSWTGQTPLTFRESASV